MENEVNHTKNTISLLSAIPLWGILVIPFTLILIVLTSITGYLSHERTQTTINDIAEQLLQETNSRIELRIQLFLETPLHINQLNQQAFENQWFDITDSDSIIHYLWKIIQLYDNVTSIYFGNPEGGLISGGREGADGSLYIITTEDFKSGEMNKYALDAEGNLSDTLFTLASFDSRNRAWYMGAVEKGGPSWTAPYVLSTGQDLAIAVSSPIYDDNDELVAVTSVDLFISHIGDFLESLTIGQNGQVYIVEHSGLLIASSTTSPIITNDGERLLAKDSDQSIIAASGKYIETLGGFNAINSTFNQRVEINGEQHYLWITPYHNDQGLDWLVVITIPEANFFSQIKTQERDTLLLTIVAVALAIALVFIITLRVSRPIERLSTVSSQYLAKGDWSQANVKIEGVKEVRQLGQSFNQMAKQLHKSFVGLENTVQERTAELAMSEDRYRAIIETQTELICRYLPDSATLTFVNEAYASYFGATVEELIGSSFLKYIPEEDHEHIRRYLKSFSSENRFIKSEHKAIDANGNIRWMEWIDHAIFDDEGKLIEVQAVGRDITEEKQYNAMLQNALSRETELNELQTHFLATVSHEFKTPMSVISTSSELLQDYNDKLTDERRAYHFNKIFAQIKRMVSLLDDIVIINRSERSIELNYEIVNISELVKDEISEILHVFHNKVQIELSSDEQCTQVAVDKNEFRLIVTNLLSNAAKYSDDGGIVQVILNCTTDEIGLTIKDYGIGIPQDAKDMVSQPFYRAKNVGGVPGTGLGLAIVKRSIARHKGTFKVESELNKGSTFTVKLPTAK